MVVTTSRRRPLKNSLTPLFKVLLLKLALGVAPWVWADAVRAVTKECIRVEERRRGLPEGLLLAIANTESGLNWRALNRNADGSYDIGVMQINSRHLPRLQQYGITLENLWHPCVNVAVGAFILHEFIAQYGLTWKAVAAYNTGSPDTKPTAALRYVEKVRDQYVRIALGRVP